MNLLQKALYINIIILSTLIAFKAHIPTVACPKTLKPTRASIRVSVVTYQESAITKNMLESFTKEFNTFGNYNVETTIYNANGNYLTLKAMAEQAVQDQKSDLTWAIGSQAADVIAPLTLKTKPKTPVLLSNISWEWLNELAHQHPVIKEYVVGWGGSYNWQLRINLMTKMIPNARRILFLHGTINRHAEWLKQMYITFADNGLTIESLNIINFTMINNAIRHSLENTDLIIVLLDGVVINMIETIIALANNYHIPLCTAEMQSVKKGAVCCIGTDLALSGAYSAAIAKKIILDKRHPNSIPFVHVEDWDIKPVLNHAAMDLQQPGTPKNIEFLMAQSIVIRKNDRTLRNTKEFYE